MPADKAVKKSVLSGFALAVRRETAPGPPRTVTPNRHPGSGPTGFTHLGPVSWRCVTPTACPRESGAAPDRSPGQAPESPVRRPRRREAAIRGPSRTLAAAPDRGPGQAPDGSPCLRRQRRRRTPPSFGSPRSARQRRRRTPPSFGSPRSTRRRESGMGPRLRGGDPRFREGRRRGQRPAQPGLSGASDARPCEMCESGRDQVRGDGVYLSSSRFDTADCRSNSFTRSDAGFRPRP